MSCKVRLPLFPLLVSLLMLSGCVWQKQPPPLYQLDSGNPGVPSQKEGPAVLLGPVTLADYLEREVLLQRNADGSLSAAETARWAGSLGADIDQLLLRHLAWRLDSQRLVLAPADPGFAPTVQVLLSIIRLDSGPEHPAVLEAQWRLLDKSGELRDSRLLRLEEAHLGTPADQVRAQGLILQRLAEQLAEAIQPLLKVAGEAPRKQAAAPARAAVPPPAPKIPLAAPTRTEGEVYRF